MYRVLDGDGVSLMTSLDSLEEPFVVVTAEALYGECDSTVSFLRTELDKAAGQQLGKERAAVWKDELSKDSKMFKVLLGGFELYDIAPGTSWKETLLLQASAYRAPCERKFVLTGGKAYPCCSTRDFCVDEYSHILVVRGDVYCTSAVYVIEGVSECLVIDMATDKIVAQKGIEVPLLPAETPAPPAAPNVRGKLVEGKLRHDCVPPVALVALAEAMQNGADKYGKFNWRSTGVSRADYYAAMMRHLLAWAGGEEVAPDSGVSHLGHIMANCAILLDGPQTE